MAYDGDVAAGARDDERSATHRWHETVEVISRTDALTYAGIKAKTKVCYEIMTKLKVRNDIETHLIRSLFRDILRA